MDSTERGGNQERLLLVGATGMIGGLVAAELLSSGRSFTVLVRPGSDAGGFAHADGVTVVRGDLNDPASLASVLDGVDRAFLLTNSSPRAAALQRGFVRAASDAGVRHVVKLSQLHPSVDSPVRFLRYHAEVEAAIRASGVAYTFVRPNLILQAFLPFAGEFARGVLQAPITPEAAVSAVDARDIAAVAVAALTQDGHEDASYDVTGPRAVTHPEIAAAIGTAIGRTVRFERIADHAYIDAVVAAGMDRWQAEGLAEDYAHYTRGEASDVTFDVQSVTGRPARSLTEFAADHTQELTGS